MKTESNHLEACDVQAGVQRQTTPATPTGRLGDDSGRDPETGRFVTGNKMSVIVGHRSQAFTRFFAVAPGHSVCIWF